MSEPFEPRESSVFDATLLRPEQLEKLPPCAANCPIGTDIRGWIGFVAQRKKLGYSREEAYSRAWNHLVDFNPFPSTTGRVCPHPCQADCTRSDKDGAVAINAMERFLGDWAIDHDLDLPRLEVDSKPESVGVIGAGPAGLSFAYQMVRRGYRVTVYEESSEPGGMLRYGIPGYRLPKEILAAEIERIVALGVELQLNTIVGESIPVEELRARHDMVFLGIGAQHSRRLRIPGEDGPGCWSGTRYLRRFNRGETVDLGQRVAVIGGGNTAIDAARAARRSGADVTILYRRTRAEMPAIEDEVDEAIAEEVRFEFLVAPLRIERRDDAIRSIAVQRMRLGAPDSSGRRRPVPLEGSQIEIAVDSVIVAVAQKPDWRGLELFQPAESGIRADGCGQVEDGFWAGGDALLPGIAGMAIAHGRTAAENVHAGFRGLPPPHPDPPSISTDRVKLDFYPDQAPTEPPALPLVEWLAQPDHEVHQTISEDAFLSEAARCFSCGLCFGCEHCWTYCNPGGYARLEEVSPGAYYSLAIDMCEGCRKCIEVCPCGYLSPARNGRQAR